MADKNYFINGITELLILSLLSVQDRYVYEITKKIGEYSNGRLSISQNTIYAATYKLKNEKKISEYTQLVGKRRTRVYYHLEPHGKRCLDELRLQFFDTIHGVEEILSFIQREEDDTSEQDC